MNWISGPRDHDIVNCGSKFEQLLVSFTGRLHLYSDKRSIIDLNAASLDRRFQPEIALFVASQNRGEELDHGRPADKRAFVMPGTITFNPHVDISAKILRLRPVFGGILWKVAVKTV